MTVVSVRAYLAAQDSEKNTFTVDENDIEIEEPDFTPPPSVSPGKSYPKTVQIKNTDGTDCYVRVKLVFSDDAVKDMITLDINETDWVYHTADGYYYYKASLASGETTSALLTKVKINASVTTDQIDSIGAFDIDVISESCQKGDAATYGQAWAKLAANE